MQDRLNFFEPYERVSPKHENQLTRALLVLLRYCPIAHQAWLSLIDDAAFPPPDLKLTRLVLHSLGSPSFHTQQAHILRNEDQPKTNEPIKGISVFCTADTSNEVGDAVLESDRGQMLDGIIMYSGDPTTDPLVIVMESKLHESADDRQARNINFFGQPVQFDGPVRKISWRNVLAAFTDLAEEKRCLVSGAEREILGDFLDFVNRRFPKLGPFNTLRRCEGEPSRVQRRLDTILSGILKTDGTTLPGTHGSVKLARFDYESEKRLAKLRMWPADTLEQARSFYAGPEVVERVLRLEDKGWSLSPNFHFGFMATGYCWTDTTMPVAEYMRYWLKRVEDTGQILRRDWDEYWRNLVNDKIAKPENREEFNRDFTNTKRPSATPRPGIRCEFEWHIDEAERLDAKGRLTNAVKERINQLLEALGEDKINSDRP